MSDRGVINNRARKKQIYDFSDMRYGNITPTDLDAGFDYKDRAFVFIEVKYRDTEIPDGQRIYLERLCDAVTSSSRGAIVFKCRHEVDNPDDDVNIADTMVTAYYYDGKWHETDGMRSLKDCTDGFLSRHAGWIESAPPPPITYDDSALDQFFGGKP